MVRPNKKGEKLAFIFYEGDTEEVFYKRIFNTLKGREAF